MSTNKEEEEIQIMKPPDTWNNLFCYLISTFLVNFINQSANAAMLIIIPLYVANELHESTTITGYMLLVYYAATPLFNPFAGWIAHKYGAYLSFMISFTISNTTLFILSLIADNKRFSNAWYLLLFVFSTNQSFYSVGYLVFTSKNTPTTKRGRFNTWIAGGRRLSYFAGSLYTGYVIQYYSIEASIIVTTIISLFSWIFFCFLFIPPKSNLNGSFMSWKQSFNYNRISISSWIDIDINPDNQSNSRSNNLNYSYLDVIKQHWKQLLSINVFAFGITFVRSVRRIILTFQGLQMHLSESQIGYINGLSYIPDTALFFVAGFIMDRYGRKYTMIPSLFLFSISCLTVSYCYDKELLIYNSLLFGFSDGIATGLLNTTGTDVAPIGCKEKFLALYLSIAGIANFTAPLMIGYLIDYFGSTRIAALVSSLFSVIALFWVICVISEPSQQHVKYKPIDNKTKGNNDRLFVENINSARYQTDK